MAQGGGSAREQRDCLVSGLKDFGHDFCTAASLGGEVATMFETLAQATSMSGTDVTAKEQLLTLRDWLMGGQADGRTGGRAGGRTDRQTDRQTGRQASRQTNKQKEKQTG